MPANIISDVDECLDHDCSPNAVCHNNAGSYQCECDPGFIGDGKQCDGKRIWLASIM